MDFGLWFLGSPALEQESRLGPDSTGFGPGESLEQDILNEQHFPWKNPDNLKCLLLHTADQLALLCKGARPCPSCQNLAFSLAMPSEAAMQVSQLSLHQVTSAQLCDVSPRNCKAENVAVVSKCHSDGKHEIYWLFTLRNIAALQQKVS